MVLLLVLLTIPAHADTRFSLVGGVNYDKPASKVAPVIVGGVSEVALTQVAPALGAAAGMLLEFSVMDGFSLEPGLLFAQRRVVQTSTYTPPLLGYSSSKTTMTTQHLQLPILFRWVPAWWLTLGIGPQISYGIGKVTWVTGRLVDSDNYANAHLTQLDYGAVGSFALRIPFSVSSSFVIDMRYHLGLNDSDPTSDVYKYRDITLLVGITFGGGNYSGR